MNRSQFSRPLHAMAVVAVCSTILQSSRAAEDELITTVNQRVQDWQPTSEELLLDQVGWASDLVEAQRLAQKHQRPLFVFTYSGSTDRANAIALRRC